MLRNRYVRLNCNACQSRDNEEKMSLSSFFYIFSRIMDPLLLTVSSSHLIKARGLANN